MKKIIASILFLMPLVSMAITHKDIEESVAPYFSGDLRYYEWYAYEPNELWLCQGWDDTAVSGNTIFFTWIACVHFSDGNTDVIDVDGVVSVSPFVSIDGVPVFDKRFYNNRWLRFSKKGGLCDRLSDQNTNSGVGMYLLQASDIAELIGATNTYYYTDVGNGNVEIGEFSKLARWRLSSALTCIRNLGIKFK